jgi:hypothetical protein
MKKLRLDVSALQVESFAPPADAERTGTVVAREPDGDNASLVDACMGGPIGGYTQGTCIGPTFCCPATWRPTCLASCNGTCAWSLCHDYEECLL